MLEFRIVVNSLLIVALLHEVKSMDYLSTRNGQALSNEPYEMSYEDIRQFYTMNLRDLEECKRVTASSSRGETYYAHDGRPGNEKIEDFEAAFFKEVLYRDAKTAGFMMRYPHGVVISQGEHSSYFRGENQIFEKSQPSLLRALERFSDEKKKQVYKLIADMRIAEFGIFLCRLGITQFWLDNYGDVLFEPLAQHYGLETTWLDITSDFNVALFFATCAWNGKKWFPLSKKETKQSEATKYGVIFHIPQWQAANIRMLDGLEMADGQTYLQNTIWPIGYQPFMRCHSQHAYGIHMEIPFPLQHDITFEKLRFRHNEKLSRDVFDLMDGGKKIYPQEGLQDFQDVIKSIASANTFSDEAFAYAFEKNTYFCDKDVAIKELRSSSVLGAPVTLIGDKHPFYITRQRIRALNRKYVGFSIEKNYGITLSYRAVMYPPEKVEENIVTNE